MTTRETHADVSIARWVDEADDRRDREFRQAVHTILDAVAAIPETSEWIALKGAILLALRYDFTRPTRDIDFSTARRVQDVDVERLLSDLSQALPASAGRLPYGLACRIQSHEQRPASAAASFPTLRIKVGYSRQLDSRRMRQLQGQSGSTQIVTIDLSFNEPLLALDWLSIDAANPTIRAYSLVDFVAEKLRAMLQQPIRNRFRAQDALDLGYLLRSQPALQTALTRLAVLTTLRAKSAERQVPVRRDGLRDPEVRRRSERDYAAFAAQLTGSPLPFDEVYDSVKDWYESLPWGRDG